MVGRLPESWIAPEHLLELRARVRRRHTLVDQRRECQQRMQAVLYHHGVPARSWLMTAESRAWLAGLALPTAAHELITTALVMIDAHDARLEPLDRELRDYAKRQPGCRALMRHYGIGPLTAITIVVELGDAGRFSSSREAVRYGGLDTCTSPMRAVLPGASRAKGPPRCGGRCLRPPSARAGPRHPTTTTTPRPRPAWAATAPPIGGAQAAQAQLPHPA